jgi:hypothetical protein
MPLPRDGVHITLGKYDEVFMFYIVWASKMWKKMILYLILVQDLTKNKLGVG